MQKKINNLQKLKEVIINIIKVIRMVDNKYIEEIKKLSEKDLHITKRKLRVMNKEIIILYVSEISDRIVISNSIIKPLLHCKNIELFNIEYIANSVIYIDDMDIYHESKDIINYVLQGKSVIIMPEDENYIVANTLKIEKRGIQTPEMQNTLKGPKDCFTENFQSNMSLIRYRIKDPNLRIENLIIGERTNTTVAMIYIKDIANDRYVKEIKKRLCKIKVDAIMESGYIQKFLRNNTSDLFPQIGIAERSDTACAGILKGKICIIVEGGNLALLMPETITEFFDSGDDHYQNIYLTVLVKVIRILSVGISLVLSSLYVAVVSFHPDILPPQYVIALANSRGTVPVNALLEATLMEGVSEILREASIRLPKQIGAAIGIVGTIVIGQAAVAAGLVSPLMVIIVSLSTMTSFVAPDYTIMDPVHILKFGLLFITATFGLFGFIMGITIIVITMVSTNTVGVAYTAPFAPFNFKDLKNFILGDITLDKQRPKYLNTKDKKKQ